MTMKDCHICRGQTYLPGLQVAEQEVIPFVKRDLLKLRYPEHPFPHRLKEILQSCLAFGQLVNHVRHRKPNEIHTYYTDQSNFLKFALELEDKFGIRVRPTSEVPPNHGEVCENNIKS